jgi:hypothetical protein
MKIIFKDFMDNEISEVQAALLDEYYKVYITSGGLVKKEETYEYNRLQRIAYYKGTAETEGEALLQLLSYQVPFTIREREKYGEFTIIKVNLYTGEYLQQKMIFLANAEDFILCTQEVNMASGKPVDEQTVKYLGNYSSDPEPNYCKFNYDKKGNFAYCDYNYVRDYESDLIEIDRLPVIKERFNLTDEMYNYYLTAALLPPLK